MPAIGGDGWIDDETDVDLSLLHEFEFGRIPDVDAIFRLITNMFPVVMFYCSWWVRGPPT